MTAVVRDPLPADAGFDYESIPPGYYDHVYYRGRGIQSKWHHLKFARVREELAGSERVLDVGCGPGTLLGSLDAADGSAGVDLSRNQVAYADQRYGTPARSFYNCRVSELPESAGEFDAVTAVELIEHLSPAEVKETLESAIGRLRPGGRLVLTTPNFGGVWPMVEAMLNRFGDVDYELQHTNKFTRSSLAVLLAMLGLVDVRVDPYLSLAPFAAAIGWGVSDRLAALERRYTEQRLGLLLIGTATKPA